MCYEVQDRKKEKQVNKNNGELEQYIMHRSYPLGTVYHPLYSLFHLLLLGMEAEGDRINISSHRESDNVLHLWTRESKWSLGLPLE